MFCGIPSANAQTADNSFTISGGEFGKGVTYVFPAGIPEANALYAGGISPKGKSMQVQAINVIVKNGKETKCADAVQYGCGCIRHLPFCQ